MEINSPNLFLDYMSVAYRSQDPVETLQYHNIKNTSRDFMLSRLVETVKNLETVLDTKEHPQLKAVTRIKQFLEDKREHHQVYYDTMFLSFATSMITIYDHVAFTYIYPNKPLEYVWFDVSYEGDSLKMICNTICSISTPFRVKLNNSSAWSFDLDDGTKLQTPRGEFLSVNGFDLTISTYTPVIDCVVILTKGLDFHRVYYNDIKREKIWECAFFNFKVK